MRLALSLACMLLATGYFSWAGGGNQNHEAAAPQGNEAQGRDFENHGAE